MRVLLQRVLRASVDVGARRVAERMFTWWSERTVTLYADARRGRVERELRDDDPGAPERLAAKVAGLRVFADADGRMQRSVLDVAGECLVVPQFTLYADARRGRRPSFDAASPPEEAAGRVAAFADALEALGVRVARGAFRETMAVGLVNDGPVTIWLEDPAGGVPGGEGPRDTMPA